MAFPTIGVTTKSYWYSYFITEYVKEGRKEYSLVRNGIETVKIPFVEPYGFVEPDADSGQKHFERKIVLPSISPSVRKYEVKIFRYPVIGPNKQPIRNDSGNILYIDDLKDQYGPVYMFTNVRNLRPDRSDDDCLVFSIIAYYRDPQKPWSNPFLYATRKGPTYKTYWEIIDLAKKDYKCRTADEIFSQIVKWVNETSNEMRQHSIDLFRYKNNVMMFTALSLMTVVGISAVAFAPAGAVGGAVGTSSPVTVTVAESTAIASPIATTVPNLATTAITALGVVTPKIVDEALNAAGEALHDAISPGKAREPVNEQNETLNEKTENGSIWIIITAGIILLFFL